MAEMPSESIPTKLLSWINHFNPYNRPTSPLSTSSLSSSSSPLTTTSPTADDTAKPRPRRAILTEMSIFKLISELLSYCNRQTVLIRQISAILPLLIHGPIRIFFQKYPSLMILPFVSPILMFFILSFFCGWVLMCSLLSNQLRIHVFQERVVTMSLRATRDALWPNGVMNPPRIPPTDSEAQKIRQKAELAALNTLPGTLPTPSPKHPSPTLLPLAHLSPFHLMPCIVDNC